MKRIALVFLTTAALAGSSLFAHDNAACCAGMAGNAMKGKCEMTFADLKLTPAQTSKMQKLAAECDKNGCNEKSMSKMEAGARKVLNKEQFAAWKAKCAGHMQKTQS